MSDQNHSGSIRASLAGLLQTGTMLIRRGTAMGPLVPVVFAAPIFGGLGAWLFRDTAMYLGVPLISAVLLLGVMAVFAAYLYHYTRFAKHDPDRLQSERYRLETHRMQYLTAKDRDAPLPPETLDPAAHNPGLASDPQSDARDPEANP